MVSSPIIAAGEQVKVAFLTALDEPLVDEARSGRNEPNADASRSTVRAAPARVTPTNSREGKSLSRNSCRGRDIGDSVEVDLVGFQPLPSSVKLSKVTERVLRKAPFARGKSKLIWRAFLSSQPFKELAADGFWFVVAHTILNEPVDPDRSPRFSRMAHVYSYMLAGVPPFFKDMWGSRFYEVWTLTLLILLQECFPKSEAVFDDPSFRLRLLDLCAEWTMGLRPSFPLTGHWILTFDRRPPTELELLKRRAFGVGLSGSASTPALSSGIKTDGRGETIPRHTSRRLNHVASRSVIEVGNSPFVEEHLKVLTGDERRAAITPLRLQVTREATRTLRPFRELVIRHSNDRTMKSNAWRAAQAIRRSGGRPTTEDILARIDQRREDLLQKHAISKREARKHIARTRADAAEDSCGIQAEAEEMFSNGDVHEFSNFLANDKNQGPRNRCCTAKQTSAAAAALEATGGTRKRRGRREEINLR